MIGIRALRAALLLPLLLAMLLAVSAFFAGAASAVTLSFQIANQNDPSSISVSNGGVTATASGWGGLTNPQATLNPWSPGDSGAQSLGVNVGTALGFGRGIGCGTVTGVSQCDLIAPGGEDLLLVEFSALVEVTRIFGTLLENPDDISAWSWNGGGWDLIGTDECPPPGFLQFCGSFGEFQGEDIGQFDAIGGGTLLPSNPTRFLAIVAEDSGASAFRLGFVDVNVIPEPSTGLLVGLGLVGLGLRRRRG